MWPFLSFHFLHKTGKKPSNNWKKTHQRCNVIDKKALLKKEISLFQKEIKLYFSRWATFYHCALELIPSSDEDT